MLHIAKGFQWVPTSYIFGGKNKIYPISIVLKFHTFLTKLHRWTVQLKIRSGSSVLKLQLHVAMVCLRIAIWVANSVDGTICSTTVFGICSGSTLFNSIFSSSFQEYLDIFLFHENICCGYSLEAPRWGASNEYPKQMFPWRNKKNISNFLSWKNVANLVLLFYYMVCVI